MIRIPEYLERHRPDGAPDGARAGGLARTQVARDRGLTPVGRLRRAARSSGPLTILIAPDSFKGSLTSVQVARALADGWARARPDDTHPPVPAGRRRRGHARGGRRGRRLDVARDGRHGSARSPDPGALAASTTGERRAVLEMAEASGLSRVAPLRARRRRGQLERHRRAAPAPRWTRAPGRRSSGSVAAPRPTAAPGCSQGLGATADRDRAVVDLAGLDPRLGRRRAGGRLRRVEPAARSDPARPRSTGRRRARRPTTWPSSIAGSRPGPMRSSRRPGVRVRDTPGAGAAGGVGFALLAIAGRFRSFALRPGVDLVMEATDFAARLAGADLVITGEGRIDAQTGFGKTALGVARRAAEAGVAVHRGRWRGRARRDRGARRASGRSPCPVVERPQSVEAAMAAGRRAARALRRAARAPGLAAVAVVRVA